MKKIGFIILLLILNVNLFSDKLGITRLPSIKTEATSTLWNTRYQEQETFLNNNKLNSTDNFKLLGITSVSLANNIFSDSSVVNLKFANVSIPISKAANNWFNSSYPIYKNTNGLDFRYDASTFELSAGSFQMKGQTLIIDGSDRVGIGVAAPSTKLEVNGTIKATAFSGDGSALTGIGGGIVGVANAGALSITADSDASGTVGHSIVFYIGATQVGAFYQSGDSTGRFGIGTVTPADSLTVTGRVTVDSITVTKTVYAEQLTSSDDASIGDDLSVTGNITCDSFTSTQKVYGSDLQASDDVDVGDDLRVTGKVTILESLSVTDYITADSLTIAETIYATALHGNGANITNLTVNDSYITNYASDVMSGTLTATGFVGNGSDLTNITMSADSGVQVISSVVQLNLHSTNNALEIAASKVRTKAVNLDGSNDTSLNYAIRSGGETIANTGSDTSLICAINANYNTINSSINFTNVACTPAGIIPTTWKDINLSATVDTNNAALYIKVTNTLGSAIGILFRQNGDVGSYATLNTTSMYCLRLNAGYSGYVFVLTDSNGIIEYMTDTPGATASITLLAYFK